MYFATFYTSEQKLGDHILYQEAACGGFQILPLCYSNPLHMKNKVFSQKLWQKFLHNSFTIVLALPLNSQRSSIMINDLDVIIYNDNPLFTLNLMEQGCRRIKLHDLCLLSLEFVQLLLSSCQFSCSDNSALYHENDTKNKRPNV